MDMENYFNLQAIIKSTRDNKKYNFIYEFGFYTGLIDSVKMNHKELLNELIDLTKKKSGTSILNIDSRMGSIQNKLLNLLNSHKRIIDILAKNYKNHLLSKHYKRFCIINSWHYDNFFDYRMMEVIRNYCQHYDTLPIRFFISHLQSGLVLIDKNKISEDKKLKKKIQGEINSKHDIEFFSIIKDWIDIVTYLYDMILDFFAGKSLNTIADFNNEFNKNVTVLKEKDPAIRKAFKSIEIKMIKNDLFYFETEGDPRIYAEEITLRMKSDESKERTEKVIEFFKDLKESKNVKRRFKKFNFDPNVLVTDTLTYKKINLWINGKNPYKPY